MEGTTEGTEAPASSGGLPQFDPQWWPGQIVWFSVIFLVVFLLMRFVFVPKIGGTIAEREGRIDADIAQARALRDQADAQAAEADAEMAAARAGAQRVASEARDAAKAEIAAGLAAEEAKVAESLAAAEARIRAARAEAMGHVESIAHETAAAIVERLTGSPASEAELGAALRGSA
jgi:F-type H+-transporting ATPase subunit b